MYKGGIGDAQSSVCCLLHVYVSAGGGCMCAPIDKYARHVFFPLSVCVLFAPGWYTTPNMLQELKNKGKKKEGEISWGDSLCTHQTIRAEQVDYILPPVHYS